LLKSSALAKSKKRDASCDEDMTPPAAHTTLDVIIFCLHFVPRNTFAVTEADRKRAKFRVHKRYNLNERGCGVACMFEGGRGGMAER